METFRTHKIKSVLKLDRYNMEDFWSACPYDIVQMKSNSRLSHFRSWRQVGMVWAHLTGLSSTDAGLLFCRDHATVIHSEKLFIHVLDGYGDPLISHAIKEVKDHVQEYIPKCRDININEAACLVVLDGLIGELLNKM